MFEAFIPYATTQYTDYLLQLINKPIFSLQLRKDFKGWMSLIPSKR